MRTEEAWPGWMSARDIGAFEDALKVSKERWRAIWVEKTVVWTRVSTTRFDTWICD